MNPAEVLRTIWDLEEDWQVLWLRRGELVMSPGNSERWAVRVEMAAISRTQAMLADRAEIRHGLPRHVVTVIR